MGCDDGFGIVCRSSCLDGSVGCVNLCPRVHLLVVGICQLMAPADSVGNVSEFSAVHTLILGIVRFRSVVATHRLPTGSLDDIIQVAVEEHASALLGAPATSKGNTCDSCILSYRTIVEDKAEPYLRAVLSGGVDSNVFGCSNIPVTDAVQRTVFKPCRTAGIDVVRGSLDDTVLIVAARLFLGAVGILVTSYLATIEGTAVTV